jgi:serine acetyltransferase
LEAEILMPATSVAIDTPRSSPVCIGAPLATVGAGLGGLLLLLSITASFLALWGVTRKDRECGHLHCILWIRFNMNLSSESRPISWAETWSLIRSDMDRLVQHLRSDSFGHRCYFALLPGFQALLWHRISRYLFLHGWRRMSRCVSLFAMYLTRSEIPPTTSIGPSALIAHPTGVYIFGRVGARLTVHGNGGFGGGFGEEDIGAGPGYAVVGDDVVMAFGARAFGAIRIGDGVKFGPSTQVMCDVPAGGLVLWTQSRIIVDAPGAPEKL